MGLQSNARSLVIQLTFISPRHGSIKPKDTTPTTLFGCYSPGNARVTRIVRELSSAAIQPDVGSQLASQGKHTRNFAQNGVTKGITALNTVYEVSRPLEQW